jgi:hypothetical protein
MGMAALASCWSTSETIKNDPIVAQGMIKTGKIRLFPDCGQGCQEQHTASEG